MGMTIKAQLEMVCEEVAKLEWINRALRQQMQFNENRLAELDKDLYRLKELEDGSN